MRPYSTCEYDYPLMIYLVCESTGVPPDVDRVVRSVGCLLSAHDGHLLRALLHLVRLLLFCAYVYLINKVICVLYVCVSVYICVYVCDAIAQQDLAYG